MKPPVIPARSGNFIYSCVAGASVCFFSQPVFACCHLRSRLSLADTPADCGVLSLLRVVQALLSQVGPPSRTWWSVLCIMTLPSRLIPPLRSGHVQFLPYSPQSRPPDTSLSPPQTLSKTHQSWALRPSSRPFLLTPVIHPGSNIRAHCSFGSGEWLLLPCLIRGHLPVYLFNWRTPTWHLRVSPGSPPLWSLSGLHHLPKLRRTGSFCFLCLPEEFYPRVPLASGLSSHGDAFRLALLPPFVWVILQEIPNLRYRFTSQGNQSWPVQPQGMGSASVLHYIGSNCERADSSTRI